MDDQTLIILLSGGHLNMPDRITSGVWPHPPIRFEDVVQFLTNHIQTVQWFPREFKSAQLGEPVQEGGVIERLEDGRYTYWNQASSPVNPVILSYHGTVEFTSAEDAARHYLKWDLRLPGDLDGWKVIP
jgi:hypothetical protein